MRKTCLAAILWLFLTAGVIACFGQNKPAFSIPFTLIDNRPYIEVKIKQHTFHFMLDCGADYGLEAKTAKILNQKLVDPMMMGGGAGAGKVTVWKTTVDTAKIGPVAVSKTKFLVVDMSEIISKLHLPYLDGMIGYQFMKDYAVQFDYPHHRINFYSAYSAPSSIPFTLYGGSIPQFKAKIDGVDAIVIVDTGDRTAFTLLNHFAIQTGIIKRYPLTDTMVTGFGLGGPVMARRFSLHQLQVGNVKLTNIASRIPMAKTGAFADTHIDGSVGGGILKQYKFTIDYKKQQIYFE